MKELEEILQLWAHARSASQSAVLATVVKTRGSSYRRPGARLLLLANGRRAGSISGGCLEEDLVKKASWLTESGPVIRRYDTTPDGEIAPAYGLGCSGIIYVLLERLSPSDAAVLQLIGEVRSGRRPAVVAHVTEPVSAVGQKLMIDTTGRVTHNLAHAELALSVEAEARSTLVEGGSRTIRLGAAIELFLETLTPAIRLLVFGAGDDAIPVTKLAKLLGWNVFVLDGRAHYARREKFPLADEVIVRSPGRANTMPAIDPWTVAVVMTHSYSQDLEILRELSSQPLRYLGVLGPRKRASQLLADADLDPEKLAPTLHSPMGLDIGADGPEQVALAVIAEVQAALNGREGGPLRERSGSIHSSDDPSGDPTHDQHGTANLRGTANQHGTATVRERMVARVSALV